MDYVPSFEIDASVLPRRSISQSKTASVLSNIVFSSLLGLIFLSFIPFGTSQPWWKALFICVVFTLAIVWLIEGYLTRNWFGDSSKLVLPLGLLAAFSFFQTLTIRSQETNIAGVSLASRTAISADPFQTTFFTLELTALIIAGVMLFRYVSTERRMRIAINVVIAVAVASALFGLVKQATGFVELFGLPMIPTGIGYGMFINRNHFAFLMEMCLGLILGLLLGGGVKREKVLIYFAALLIIWTALVLSDSRGALIAMLAQVVTATLLFGIGRKAIVTGRQSSLTRISNSMPARIGLIVLLVLGVILGTLWLGGDRLALRIDESREQLSSEDVLRTGVSRQEIWKASWRLFATHPVLGVGMGAYWAAIPTVHAGSGAMTPREAHNDYLELLASGGLVGAALFAWFVVVVCRRTRENLRSANRFRRAACYAAAIGIAGVAVHSLLDFGLHLMANALVFTTLIVIATSKPHWADEPSRLYD